MTQWRKRRHHSNRCSPDSYSTCSHFLFKGNAAWSHYEALNHHKRQVVIKNENAFFQETARDIYFVHVMCFLGRSTPASHHTAAVAAVVYIRAYGRLPDAKGLTVYQWKRVVNMGTQPLSWPWCRTIHHLGLEKGLRLRGVSRWRTLNPGESLYVLASIQPPSWLSWEACMRIGKYYLYCYDVITIKIWTHKCKI